MLKQLKIFSANEIIIMHSSPCYMVSIAFVVHCDFLNIQGDKFLFQWYLFLEAIALANASLEKPETLLVPTLVPNLIFLPRAFKICNTELYSYFPTCLLCLLFLRVFCLLLDESFCFSRNYQATI